MVFGDEAGEPGDPLGDVAVAAAAYGVRVVVGDRLALGAGIEAEHAARVALERLLGQSHDLGAVGHGVPRLEHLHQQAAAVPSVRRCDLGPHRVGHREGDAVEGGVLGTGAAVLGPLRSS